MVRVTDPEDKQNTPDQQDRETQQESEADNNEGEPADIVKDEENEGADNGENKRENNAKMNINIH
jgi:hypothetical protein